MPAARRGDQVRGGVRFGALDLVGQSVVLPYLQGRSTTGLVTRATERVAPAR